MKKKWNQTMALALSGILAFSLSACGQDKNEPTESNTESTTESTAAGTPDNSGEESATPVL